MHNCYIRNKHPIHRPALAHWGADPELSITLAMLVMSMIMIAMIIHNNINMHNNNNNDTK